MKFSSKFISAGNECADFDNMVNAPMFRKSFEIEKMPQKAELTICGLGFYELFLNGCNITRGELSSYIANPDLVCYYDCYDIKPHLKKGKNVIGILLGNGFRNPFGGFVWDFDKADFRGPLTLALCCELDDKNFEADTSFKTHPSAILFDDLRMGCRYDAREEIEGWPETDFDDSSWNNAVVCKKPPLGEPRICKAPPVKIKEKIIPISVTHHDKMPFAHADASLNSRPLEQTYRENVYLYDFGKNLSGVTRVYVKNALPGQKITIRHGEILINGEFSISNLMFFNSQDTIDKYLEYSQCDVYICKGGDEVFVPKFKYDGFRYAYVEGLLPQQATSDALTFLVEYSDISTRAGFSSSDMVLNALFDMTRNSTLSNMVHIPTDCPHREKNGWTGDVAMSAEHFLLNTDCADFLKEWLFNVSKSQTEKGDIPAIVPTGLWGYGDVYTGPVWDSVCVNLVYALYKYGGDTDVISDNADFLMKYFEYLKTKKNKNGLISYGLGDWAEPLRRYREGYKTASPVEVTASVAAYEMLKKAEFLFCEAKLNDNAEKVKKYAESLRADIREHLIDFDTFIVKGNCQTSQAYAIAAGIFNLDELSKAKDVLVKMVKHDQMLICGIVGRRCIFDVLCEMGECDMALDLIVGSDVASCGNWVKKGYTTICESFTPDGIKVDSRNHHYMGDISRWMIEYAAGLKINPDCRDFYSFLIAPQFSRRLKHAEAYFDYNPGRLSMSWIREDNKIILKVIVPPECHGNIRLPKGYKFANDIDDVLCEGTYHFEISDI